MDKRWWRSFVLLSLALFLVACMSQPEIVEVTRIVTETTVVEGEAVEVTRVVIDEVEVEVTRQVPADVPPTAEPLSITIIQGVDPVSLDPQVGESGPKQNVLIHIFDFLTSINDDMEVVPQAAESWTVQEDGLTWRIVIREGINFWNGEPLDANAVKYTMDRTMDAALREQGLTDPFAQRVDLAEVIVVDDYTVDVVTNSPQPLMGLWLSFLAILEPTHYESISFGDASINPMGSGAYTLAEWIKDDHVTLERNPDWWAGTAPIQTLILRSVPEASVRLSELETGGADLVTDLKPEDISRVALMDHARIASVESSRRIHIGINVQREYLQDPRVAQALNYAINWEEINVALFGGLANRLVSVTAGWVPEDLEPYPYDPELAVSLLEEAGFPFERQLILNTPVGRYLKDVEIAQAVAAQLGDIGVQVEVIPLDFSVMLPLAQSRGLEDLWLLGYGSRLNGLEDLQPLTSESSLNPGAWSNAEFEALYAEASSLLTPEEQLPVVQEAIRVAYENPPWIFINRQIAIYGVSNTLSDWQPRPDERIRLDGFN